MKVGTEKITREKGYLYYVDGQGYVVKVKRGKKGSKARVSKTPIARQKGNLYYLGKSGYVEASPMARRGKKKRMRA